MGYRIVGHRAELTDFWAVLRNSTLWMAFLHTVLAAYVTGAMVVLGVSAWQLLQGRPSEADATAGLRRPASGADDSGRGVAEYLGTTRRVTLSIVPRGRTELAVADSVPAMVS